MEKKGGRNINPFRKKTESEQLTMPEENRLAIVGLIEEIEELKNRVEELENDS